MFSAAISPKYRTANIGDSQQLQVTDDVTVSGYPLPGDIQIKREDKPDIKQGKLDNILTPKALLESKKGATLKMVN